MKLKSTGQHVVVVPWTATAVKPWRDGYQRVLLITPKHHRNSMQIVRDENLVSSDL